MVSKVFTIIDARDFGGDAFQMFIGLRTINKIHIVSHLPKVNNKQCKQNLLIAIIELV